MGISHSFSGLRAWHGTSAIRRATVLVECYRLVDYTCCRLAACCIQEKFKSIRSRIWASLLNLSVESAVTLKQSIGAKDSVNSTNLTLLIIFMSQKVWVKKSTWFWRTKPLTLKTFSGWDTIALSAIHGTISWIFRSAPIILPARQGIYAKNAMYLCGLSHTAIMQKNLGNAKNAAALARKQRWLDAGIKKLYCPLIATGAIDDKKLHNDSVGKRRGRFVHTREFITFWTAAADFVEESHLFWRSETGKAAVWNAQDRIFRSFAVANSLASCVSLQDRVSSFLHWVVPLQRKLI